MEHLISSLEECQAGSTSSILFKIEIENKIKPH